MTLGGRAELTFTQTGTRTPPHRTGRCARVWTPTTKGQTMDVQGFDSMDEMFAAMAASEDAANVRLTPGQIRLRDDMGHTRWWAQAIPEWDLVVYGRAETTWSVQANSGFDATENRERGYLTGTAYSADLPEGEYGDKHVSEVVPIPEHVFLAAQTAGWPRFSALAFNAEHRDIILGLAIAEQEASR